jgi:N-acetylmuramoyl-L-alanine amidase
MNNYYWLLDAGHGGFKNGVYTTAPAKMFCFEDGFTIYEGEINRAISNKLQKMLHNECIDFALVYDEVEDTSLRQRISIANRVHAKHPNAVLLSIHSNAGGGKGFEVFTSIGETKADPIAEIFCKSYIKYLPHFNFRPDPSDGDHDKEARFAMVDPDKGITCPALLVENLFFDNRQEAEYLKSDVGQHEIALCLFESIKEVEKIKPI